MDRCGRVSGFTIIEVTLVLAITSLLAIGIISVIQSSITNQRYNDSVNSFRDFLQDQYNQVGSMTIQDDWRKEHNTNFCEGGGTARVGRTNCYQIGRLLVTNYRYKINSSGGQETGASDPPISVVSWDVLATIPGDTIDRSQSLHQLFSPSPTGGGAKMSALTYTRSEYELPWGANLAQVNGDQVQLAILIIRSPIDGSLRTYVDDFQGAVNWSWTSDNAVYDEVPSKLLNDDNLQRSAVFCVRPAGINFITKRAVRLLAGGANASAVELAPRDQTIGGVEAVKCH